MDDCAVPGPLAAALLDAGYRVGGPAGVGGSGPVWTAVPVGAGGARGAGRVVVQPLTVPDGAAGARLAEHLTALRELSHPHLPEVVDVVAVPTPPDPGAGTWAVLLAEVPGATVAALLAARGRLSVGEVVTLTVPVAGALDALHRLGLVHGDVSPANIVVRPDGRPVLIDVLGALRPARTADDRRGDPGDADGSEDGRGPRGTPGFTAPELTEPPSRRRGGPGRAGPRAEGPPVAAPADVFALAAVALAALDLAAHDGRLGQELRAACAPEPVRRPTAAELAAALYACADPAPIAQPDAGVLARAALAELAAPARTVSLTTGARHRAGRRQPWRRRLATAGAVAVLVPAVGWTVVGGERHAGPPGAATVVGVADPTGRPSHAAPGPPAPEPTTAPTRPTAPAVATPSAAAPGPDRAHADPVAAAVTLTRHRASVLADGDPARLAEVAVAGSPAHAADRALLDRLATAGVTLVGVRAVVEEAALVPSPTAAAAGTTVAVRVRAGLAAHTRRSPSGTVRVPAEPPRAVVLRLDRTDDGWRVVEVLPG